MISNSYLKLLRIPDIGKLGLQQLRYPANIPPIPRPVLKKYPAYPAKTPPVLIKNIPRRRCTLEKDTPLRRVDQIMRFICSI
jgi:hypothetical protein